MRFRADQDRRKVSIALGGEPIGGIEIIETKWQIIGRQKYKPTTTGSRPRP